jgi:hypothetical protein
LGSNGFGGDAGQKSHRERGNKNKEDQNDHQDEGFLPMAMTGGRMSE